MNPVPNTACVNIGPQQRRLRMRMGIVMFAIALLLAIAMAVMSTPPSARIVLFVPLLLGSLGVLQARAHTCVALAAKGLRNMDAGNDRVDDSSVAVLKARGRTVLLQSIALAGALTVAVMAL
jgi:hypothetical protein